MPRHSRSPLPPFNETDLYAFLEKIGRLAIGTNYTELDRARDFQRVFSTPEGERVLKQIMAFCNPPSLPTTRAGDLGALAEQNGMRKVGERIARAFVIRQRQPENEEK